MQEIPILDRGKPRMVTLFEATLIVLRKNALAGRFKSQQELLRLHERTTIPLDTDAAGVPIDYGAQVRRKLDDMAARLDIERAVQAEMAAGATSQGAVADTDDRIAPEA